jgi:PAP2 superfamily
MVERRRGGAAARRSGWREFFFVAIYRLYSLTRLLDAGRPSTARANARHLLRAERWHGWIRAGKAHTNRDDAARGIVGYAAFPLAPPRELPGFVDTIGRYGWWGSAASAPEGPGALTNQYAAMPSLNIGWALLFAWQVIKYGRRRSRARTREGLSGGHGLRRNEDSESLPSRRGRRIRRASAWTRRQHHIDPDRSRRSVPHRPQIDHRL